MRNKGINRGRFGDLIAGTLALAVVAGAAFMNRNSTVDVAKWYDVNGDGAKDAIVYLEASSPTHMTPRIVAYDSESVCEDSEGDTRRKSFAQPETIAVLDGGRVSDIAGVDFGDFDKNGKLDVRVNDKDGSATDYEVGK